jgi:hypothetical protein
MRNILKIEHKLFPFIIEWDGQQCLATDRQNRIHTVPEISKFEQIKTIIETNMSWWEFVSKYEVNWVASGI